MKKSSPQSKTAIIKRIVDIDVALARENMDSDERRKLRAERDRLMRRVYH